MCNALWLSQYKTGKREGAWYKSCNRKHIHWSSLVAEANALYSASAEEHATLGCFLDFQDTRELPMKKQLPYMDLLVSTHPPQSTSLKPKKSCKSADWGKNKPRPGDFLRYLNTLRAAM